MTEADRQKLEEAVAVWRVAAEPMGPIHAYWDYIMDAEALLSGKPATLNLVRLLEAYEEDNKKAGKG